MQELVSIIVPIYNVDKYLSCCIESILKQTYTNFELILVNDGSTDNSGEICDLYSKKDHRVIVVHKKNEGVSVARNIGIQWARGKYIQFVDSDDFIDENMTEILMREISGKNAFPVCNIVLYYESHNKKVNIARLYKDVDTISIQQYLTRFLLELKTSPFIGSPCNKIFEKEIITNNKIEFQEGRTFAEDFLFNLEYLKYVNKVSIVNSPLYTYRMETHDSLTKNTQPIEYWWDNYKIIFQKYSEIFINYDLYKKYNRKINIFIEFAARDCIRKCFRSKSTLTLLQKAQKLKYVCEDNLTKKLLPNFECKDFYTKTIKFFSQRNRYITLALLLVWHSGLVEIYKWIGNLKGGIINGKMSLNKFF